jgi:hypothetical protein
MTLLYAHLAPDQKREAIEKLCSREQADGGGAAVADSETAAPDSS